MCEFVVNVVDVENLDAKKKKWLMNYLERRKKELETSLGSVNEALKKVKSTHKKRKR